MSLDVYLYSPSCPHCGLSPDPWTKNITHNLGKMAAEYGLYEPLWRPDEIGITLARDLVPLLESGLAKLKADPEGAKKHSPPNGWGKYEGLVRFVEEYIDACHKLPLATIRVSR